MKIDETYENFGFLYSFEQIPKSSKKALGIQGVMRSSCGGDVDIGDGKRQI